MADIVCFWDSMVRSWVVICVDAEGNQIWEADYYANKDSLRAAWQCK